MPTIDYLGIAIGMVMVYLLMSLVATAVMEYIESKVKQRAKDLEKGILFLLGSNTGSFAVMIPQGAGKKAGQQ